MPGNPRRSTEKRAPSGDLPSSPSMSFGDIEDLRAKNRQLAKSNAEYRKKWVEVICERDNLRRELVASRSKINTLTNRDEQLEKACREGIDAIVVVSNVLTTIYTQLRAKDAIVTPKFVKAARAQNQQKTKAVKPMVSGHTISKPTIKLNRISENLLQTVNGASRIQREEEVEQAEFSPRRLNGGDVEMEADVNGLMGEMEEEEETDEGTPGLSRITEESEVAQSTHNEVSENLEVHGTPDFAAVRFRSTPRRPDNSAQESSSAASDVSTPRRSERRSHENTSASLLVATASLPSTSAATLTPRHRQSTSPSYTLRRSDRSRQETVTTDHSSAFTRENTGSTFRQSEVTRGVASTSRWEAATEMEFHDSSSPSRSMYVTKRSRSRKFSDGSPRVVLQRLETVEGGTPNKKRKKRKAEMKIAPRSPVKRHRRAATQNKSYKEPPLVGKMRRP